MTPSQPKRAIYNQFLKMRPFHRFLHPAHLTSIPPNSHSKQFKWIIHHSHKLLHKSNQIDMAIKENPGVRASGAPSSGHFTPLTNPLKEQRNHPLLHHCRVLPPYPVYISIIISTRPLHSLIIIIAPHPPIQVQRTKNTCWAIVPNMSLTCP